MKKLVVFSTLLLLACSSTVVYDNHARVVSVNDEWMNLQIYDQSCHILHLEPGVQVGDTLHVVIESRDGILEVRVEGMSSD